MSITTIGNNKVFAVEKGCDEKIGEINNSASSDNKQFDSKDCASLTSDYLIDGQNVKDIAKKLHRSEDEIIQTYKKYIDHNNANILSIIKQDKCEGQNTIDRIYFSLVWAIIHSIEVTKR
ncbi:MAG: hypothetical protein IJ848_03050 [Alphaproteobacteria bacterium]|nr:hypothetical protein [Alphaproteobacteria bacterium]